MRAVEMVQPFPFVTIEGGPKDRGEQYGRQAGDLIAKAIAAYKIEFASSGVDWQLALELAGEFRLELEKYDPQMVEEFIWIARASDQPVEAIVALNARTELMFWRGRERIPQVTGAASDECTGFIALPEATSEGRVLHGQNWDWRPASLGFGLVLRVIAPDAPSILTFVEAGQLARHGFSSAGVALTASGLHSDLDYGRFGVPSPMVRRRALSSPNLGQAVGTILRAKRAFSHNLFLSHADGEGVGLETTPEHAFWFMPEEGLLAHANHFRHPASLQRVTDLGLQRTPESLYRHGRLLAGLKRAHGRIDVPLIKQLLADDFGTPDAICRPPAVRPGGALSATVASLIMDPAARRMWIAPAPYEGAHYTEYRLDA